VSGNETKYYGHAPRSDEEGLGKLLWKENIHKE